MLSKATPLLGICCRPTPTVKDTKSSTYLWHGRVDNWQTLSILYALFCPAYVVDSLLFGKGVRRQQPAMAAMY